MLPMKLSKFIATAVYMDAISIIITPKYEMFQILECK